MVLGNIIKYAVTVRETNIEDIRRISDTDLIWKFMSSNAVRSCESGRILSGFGFPFLSLNRAVES